jgi:hypothetical protein
MVSRIYDQTVHGVDEFDSHLILEAFGPAQQHKWIQEVTPK